MSVRSVVNWRTEVEAGLRVRGELRLTLPVLTKVEPPRLSRLLASIRPRVRPHWVVAPSSRLYDWNNTLTGLRFGSPHSKEVLMEFTRSAPALAGDS